jgi:hypothetical protein
MKTLRSFDSVWQFARLDTETGDSARLPIWRTIFWRNVHTHGWYKTFNGVIAALYVDEGELYFWFGGDVIRIDDETSAILHRVDNAHRLVLSRGSDRVQMNYMPPRPWPPIDRDPTAFVDEEQIDFGLFAYCVVRDPQRRRRIIESHAS